jgi:hypothetical protein
MSPQGSIRSPHGGFHGNINQGFNNTFLILEEPRVVHDVIVVHDSPDQSPEPPALPPRPRETYVLGRTYASLPAGCMKMVERGVAYFQCSGKWYRQLGTRFKAVPMP